MDKLRAIAKLLALCFAEEACIGRARIWTFDGKETCSKYTIAVRVEVMSREVEEGDSIA